jgi:hypothetical protein
MVSHVKFQWFCLAAGFWAAAVSAADPEAADQARTAIAAAEKALAQAAAERALWTSAEEALRRARSALEAGDTDTARKLAATATEQARLGLAQKQYPLTSAR